MMCGTRNDEVFALLKNARYPVVYKTPKERLKQIVEAQNLFSHGDKRVSALQLAETFYSECLNVTDWSDVVGLACRYLKQSEEEQNEYLRWLLLSLLDVLEEDCSSNTYQADIRKQIDEAMSVRLDFTSSKGMSLYEVFEKSGSKEQFLVILTFLSDHPRCKGDLKSAVDLLREHLEQLDEYKKCA